MSAMQKFVISSEAKPAAVQAPPQPSLNELDKMTPQLGDPKQHETFANLAESFIGLLFLVFILVCFFQYIMASASGV